MKAPPADCDVGELQRVLEQRWGIDAETLPYLAVGFGDHHWLANTARARYFVTVRDLRLDGRTDDRRQAVPLLEQTFRAVRRLAREAQLEFIVPPVPSTTGALVVPLGETFAVSVYDWLELEPAPDADGRIAAGLVARLHRAWREHRVPAVHDDLRVPHRAALERALAVLEQPWEMGPYAEPARAQLLAHQGQVRTALERYDALVAQASTSTTGWCLTHGEPSGGNLVRDQTGVCYLVDWESARIAPPERDLVDLASSPAAVARYQAVAGGPPPRAELVQLYQQWYALAETAGYVLQFRAPHTADDNMRQSWQNFLVFLPRGS